MYNMCEIMYTCIHVYGVWFDQLPGGRGGGGFDFDDHITERLIIEFVQNDTFVGLRI